MTAIKNIPAVTIAVPKEVANILVPMKQAIESLAKTVSDMGAGFEESVVKIVLSPTVTERLPPADDEDIEHFFDEVKALVAQAQKDAEQLREPINVNASMAYDALGQSQRNLSDIIGISSDLSDQADDLAQQALDILDLATDVDLLQTTVGGLSDDFLATSTLLDATVSRVDSNEDSIDVITAAITSLQAELIDTTAFDPGIVWQFESSDDGWTSNFTLTTNDFFISVPDDAGTYIRSPSGIAIDGRLYTRIIARIRRTAGSGWLGRASYATSGRSAHGIDTGAYYLTLVTEPTFAGGGWVIVVWDMEMLTAGGTDWVDNIIDQIQLELSDDSSTTFDVDWVAIGRVAPSFFSGSLSALTSRVTATEDAIDAVSTRVDSLESRADDLEDGAAATSTALDTLSTRVTATEDSIDTQASQISSLGSRVTTAEGNISSTSTALTALTTRVTSAEGVNTSQSASITTLTSGLASANTGITANSTAISGLDTRVTATESSNTTQSGQITALESTVNNPTTGVAATATGLSNLTTRVTSAEGVNTSQATQLTNLESTVNNPTTGVVATAGALSTLQTTVTNQGGTLTSQSQQITLLSARQTEGPSLINPLTSPGNNFDWDVPAFGVLPASDIVQVNIGGRNKAAARIVTNGDVQRISKMIEIDQSAIYEIRFSLLKNAAHGSMFFGMAASNDGVTYDNVACVPIVNRAVANSPATNQYLFFVPQGANRVDTTAFSANQWYDVVGYIVGANAPINRVPQATINGTNRFEGFSPITDSQVYIPDGVQLGSSARFVQLRFLNYYNGVLTTLYCNQVTMRKILGRDAGIDQEVADRQAAISTEQTARVSGDQANATSITNLTTTVNGNTSSISSLTSSVNGISAQWVLRLDNNGRISGIRLAGTPTFASFAIVVDQFSISFPGNPGVTTTPFIVGNIGGIPTVGINGNLVVDGTIITRNLLDQSVTTPKMAPQSVNRAILAQGGALGIPQNSAVNVIQTNLIAQTSGSSMLLFWSISINHNVNNDPANKISVTIFRDINGGGFSALKTYLLNSRNFLGEVYPAYTRLEVLQGVGAGTNVTYIIQVINNSSDTGFVVNESTLYLKEEMR